MASGSGAVTKVATNQTTVLMATVTSMTHAAPLKSPSGKRGLMILIAASDTMKEAVMALISLHALMRHQYQRRISTRPVPDPRANRNFHAPSIVLSCIVTRADARNRNTVAMRDTAT